MRGLCAFALALGVGCGGGAAATVTSARATPAGTTPSSDDAPLSTSELDVHRAIARFAGRYPTQEFVQAENTCPIQFRNSVPFVVIDADARVLYTEGEARHYDLRMEGEELVAEAWFGGERDGSLCASSQFNERWRFRKQADGSLAGAIEGLWPVPPNCMHACRVRFTVTTGPSAGEGHAPPRPPPPVPEDRD